MKYPKRLAGLVRSRPFGLVTDLDGTLSPIVSTPQVAEIDPRCRETLVLLVKRLELVAIVSGRRAANLRDMVGIPGIVYVGNHGLERWRDGGVKILEAAEPYLQEIGAILSVARERLDVPGLVFEDKAIVAGIHYRLAADPARARTAILDFVRPLAGKLRIAEGKRVVEIRPPIDCDKGTALEELVDEYRLRAAVYLGDDLTDLAALRSLHRLRRAGIVSGVSIGVMGAETPEEVVREADYSVQGVAGVGQVLALIDSYL